VDCDGRGGFLGGLNSEGSSPDLVLSSRVKPDGTLPHGGKSSEVHCEGVNSNESPSDSSNIVNSWIWNGTPWNGFRAFRGDMFGKCARFIQDYILRAFNNNATYQSKSIIRLIYIFSASIQHKSNTAQQIY
jgi:hypothetical protein